MKHLPIAGNHGKTLVDNEDYDELSRLKWYSNGQGNLDHIWTKISGKKIYIHRFLLNPPKNKVVDHINGNPLDNRRRNLRICTQSQNCMNARLKSSSVSGVKGVSQVKKTGQWLAQIMLNGKCKSLGIFTDKEDAIRARSIAEAYYFGKFGQIDIDQANGFVPDDMTRNMSRASRNSISGHRYIRWDNQRKRWVIIKIIDGRRHRLGQFKTVEEAIKRRDEVLLNGRV